MSSKNATCQGFMWDISEFMTKKPFFIKIVIIRQKLIDSSLVTKFVKP